MNSISYNWVRLPIISIKKIYDNDLKVVYYHLYLNQELEGIYDSVKSLNFRIGMLIAEEAMATEV